MTTSVLAAPVTAADVRHALESVADPEIPGVSVVELGMIGEIEVSADRIRVELLPTFVGCPAIGIIEATVRERLEAFGRPVEAEISFATPWTSDRISPEGREKLRRSGFAPPAEPANVRCPYCESAKVAMDSAFGPTQCRSLYYCRDCRQPFEAFKPI